VYRLYLFVDAGGIIRLEHRSSAAGLRVDTARIGNGLVVAEHVVGGPVHVRLDTATLQLHGQHTQTYAARTYVRYMLRFFTRAARRYASAGISCRRVSVCVCLSVICRYCIETAKLCFKAITVSPIIRVGLFSSETLSQTLQDLQ